MNRLTPRGQTVAAFIILAALIAAIVAANALETYLFGPSS